MADALASVRAGYDRWASVYDHDANPLRHSKDRWSGGGREPQD